MNKGLFVTATSTGTGKTVFSAILGRFLACAGYKIAYYKPVQTGAVRINQKWFAPDCLFIENCLQDLPGFTTHCTCLLKKPASPHLAARLEHQQISLAKIREDYTGLAAVHDYIIVEGAGGLYVPLDEQLTLVADIPVFLDIPAVLVAAAGLGTINHTALSFAFARSRNMRISLIILFTSGLIPTDIEADNAAVLRRITGLERVCLVPAIEGVDVDAGNPGNLRDAALDLAGKFGAGGVFIE